MGDRARGVCQSCRRELPRAVGPRTARAQALECRTRRLRVTQASHSPMMEPLLTPFRAVAESLSYAPATLPIVSTLTGALGVEGRSLPGVRHAVHLDQPTVFADVLRQLAG